MAKLARYAGIDRFDTVNGEGIGCTLYFQGCPHHCPGCHNPSTWSFDGGEELTLEVLRKMEVILKHTRVKRLTLSGGDPLCDSNITYAVIIARWFKRNHPDKKLWVYTGYTYDQILQDHSKKRILEYADVIVDGPFIEALKDPSLPYRGSSNQNIIRVKKDQN